MKTHDTNNAGAWGSLMDPAFVRRAADDSHAAFAHVTHGNGAASPAWARLRHRAQALRDWVFPRAAH